MCTEAAQTAAGLHEEGRSTRGGRYVVGSVAPDGFFDLSRPILRVVFDRERRATLDATGRELDVLEAGTFVSCQVVLVRDGSAWRVVDAQLTESLF